MNIITRDGTTQTLESAFFHLEDKSAFWSHQFSRNTERNIRRVFENVLEELDSRIPGAHQTGIDDDYWSKGLRCIKKWNEAMLEDDMRKIRMHSSHFDDHFDQAFRCFVDQSFCKLEKGKVDSRRTPDAMWFYREYVRAVCDLQVVKCRQAYRTASYVTLRVAFIEAMETALERCANECVVVQTVPVDHIGHVGVELDTMEIRLDDKKEGPSPEEPDSAPDSAPARERAWGQDRGPIGEEDGAVNRNM
jgi:hypothetical protein